MTNEDAMQALEIAKAEIEWAYPMDYQIALDMAIKALKQQSADGCKDCKYEDKDEYEMPCLMCKNNKMNYWRAKE